jgi:hypothetical protein
LGNLLFFAIPLALFEIWLENFKSGWDGEFIHPFWGKKIYWGWMLKVFQKRYVTPYHLIMFGVIIPLITLTEYLMLHFLDGSRWIVVSFGKVTIIPPLFILALWLGNMVVEDFLWFALNTWFHFRFPDALHKLFKGEFKWHTQWVNITHNVMLPRFYLTTPIWIAILLAAEEILIRIIR